MVTKYQGRAEMGKLTAPSALVYNFNLFCPGLPGSLYFLPGLDLNQLCFKHFVNLFCSNNFL